MIIFNRFIVNNVKYFLILSLFHLFGLVPLSGSEVISENVSENDDHARYNRNLAQETRWLEDIPQMLEEFPANPTDQQIFALSNKLKLFSHKHRWFRIKNVEAAPYYDKIQSVLLKTPGHAEAFERKYLQLRNDVVDGKLHWVGSLSEYNQTIWSKLSDLPSPETMRVLGRMLEDTQGGRGYELFPRQPKFLTATTSAAETAVFTLYQIGIQNPPDASAPSYYHVMENAVDYLPAWKTWWQEVKDGKRTYKFKGSDVIYNYDGPVEPKPVRRLRENRNEESATALKTAPAAASTGQSESKTTGPFVWGAVALGALVVGFCRLLVMKKKAA